MVRHLSRILHDGERVPSHRQRAFFARMSERPAVAQSFQREGIPPFGNT